MPTRSRLPTLLLMAAVVTLTAVHADDEKPKLAYQPVMLVQLAVKDLDRSVKFYGQVLDLELEYRIEELKWAKFKTALPGVSIGLGESQQAAGSGTVSVNLTVDDTDAARALLEKRGVKFLGETTDIPGVVRLATFQDPDGNRFRLAGPSQAKH